MTAGRALGLAICLAALGVTAPALAEPNAQLVRSVQHRIDALGLSGDVASFDTATVSALHLALSNGDTPYEKRNTVRAILQRATETQTQIRSQ